MSNKKINWRAFISVYMGISFLIMIISGIILFVSPPGRIAHWSYWALLGLTKSEWQAVHTIYTFIFIVVGIFHLIYNWKPMLNYFRTKSNGAKKIRRELILAFVLTLFVFIGTYGSIPPFGSVMEIGEEITNSWSNENNEPPVPHAESLTISEFSKEIGVPLKRVEKVLNEKGYRVKDTSTTIETIAEENDITPNEIYLTIKLSTGQNRKKNGTGYTPGSGFGRKMMSEVFSENNFTWEEGVVKLKKNGIKVESDGKLKDIASDNNITPIEIVKALDIN